MRPSASYVITWGVLLVLIWAATFWSVQWLIRTWTRSTEGAGLERSLTGYRAAAAERTERMRQGCRLVTSVPEFRALIGGERAEPASENPCALTERLDALRVVMDASCVCVLDARGGVVAQSTDSPWSSLDELRAFLAASPQASALVSRSLADADRGADGRQPLGVWGLWPDAGDLFHVVAMALLRGPEGSGRPRVEGVLVAVTRISDDVAKSMIEAYGGDLTLIVGGRVVASSLPADARREIERRAPAEGVTTPGVALEVTLAGRAYRSATERLIDPCSGAAIGAVLVHAAPADVSGLRRDVTLVVGGAHGAGLLAGWLVFARIPRRGVARGRPVRGRRGVRRVDADDRSAAQHARRTEEALSRLAGGDAFAQAFDALDTLQEHVRQCEDLIHDDRSPGERAPASHPGASAPPQQRGSSGSSLN